MFANLAYKIGDNDPLADLKVELARLHESSRFPTDELARSLGGRDALIGDRHTICYVGEDHEKPLSIVVW